MSEIDEEIKRVHEIEEQISELCAEYCQLNGYGQMDVVYLKDKVLFGEL